MTDASRENLSEKQEFQARQQSVNEFVNKAFELDQSIIQRHQDSKNANASKTGSNFMDFDDLLPHIGEFGRYQKILFLLMIPYATFLVFVYFTQIFITLVPEHHWCFVPELQHLNVDERLVCVYFSTQFLVDFDL